MLKKLDIFSVIKRYLDSGKVKHIGFSFHGELPDFKTIVDAYDWDFCQIQYNLRDEYYQAGLEGLKYAAAKGMAVVIMEPVRGGSLATEPAEDIKAAWDRAPVKYTPAQWAFRWVFNHPEATVVLSGMSTMEQVVDNLKTADTTLPGSMTAEELKIVDEVKKIYDSRVKVNCTGCEYCMPCPFGVNIPNNFKVYNEAFMYNALNIYKGRYKFMDENSRASNCQECGACEAACPQSLPIREQLKKVAEIFG
jgi:predicted aldo/keto reductase-like oxidoreductase